MIRRMVCNPVVSLCLVITAILASDCSFAQAQEPLPAPGTPQLIFSTYLGGWTPCADLQRCPHLRPERRQRRPGKYLRDRSHPVLRPSRAERLSTEARAAQRDVGFRGEVRPRRQSALATYLGGNKQSMGVGVAAMPDGGVAVVGMTSSDAAGPFPTKNAFQDHNNGESDYFVTVFDANGNLRYSTYLGGSGADGSGFTDDNSNGNNVAVDAHGLVYVAGTTSSGGGDGGIKFPVTDNALQSDLKGSTDAFLCIFDPAKSGADSLVYCSFLGGERDEKGHSVTVNARGDLSPWQAIPIPTISRPPPTLTEATMPPRVTPATDFCRSSNPASPAIPPRNTRRATPPISAPTQMRRGMTPTP